MELKKFIYKMLFLIILLLALPNMILANENTVIQEEIIYNILIDRFNNGSQAPSQQIDIDDPLTYHGGDIQGIIAMLDRIKEYGFTTISLSPIMENAPRAYHGYVIEDFFEVESEFGSLEDFKELVDEAHKRDMKVILELVTNYVAKTSPLVQAEKSWFKDVNIEPMEATQWLGEVVQLDQTKEEVQAYLLDMANFWIDETKIDGYMLHAADQMSETFLHRLTKEIKERNPDFYMIAKPLQADSLESICKLDTIDAVRDESMIEVIQTVLSHVDRPISELYEQRKAIDCPTLLLEADHQDIARFSNLVADRGRNTVTAWTLALTYLYLTPGLPSIYQGSEVPMYGPGFPESQNMVEMISADPDLKKVYERISSAREMFPALIQGDFEQVATDRGFSLFKRSWEGENVFFAINNDSESRFVKLDGIDQSMQLRGLFHDDTVRINEDGEFVISLSRESAEVYILQPNEGFNWLFIILLSAVMGLFILAVVFLTIKQKGREIEGNQSEI